MVEYIIIITIVSHCIDTLIARQNQIREMLGWQEAKQDSLASALAELKQLVAQQIQSSFSLKSANLEVGAIACTCS